MPHGLIAAFGGDTVVAARSSPVGSLRRMNVIVLVDSRMTRCAPRSRVADALGDELLGRRLGTSEKWWTGRYGTRCDELRPTGVNPVLVERVRHALDASGHERVRIILPGGFDSAKSGTFEDSAAGRRLRSGILPRAGQNDFTGDIS